jgi:hypothetical protein
MPLVLASLQSGLQSCFADPPATYAECAQAWADAAQAWAAAIVPASTTVSAAAAALSSALAGAFAAPDAIPGMESAFAAFAVTVGGGMAAAGYAPTPPAGPVGLVTEFAEPLPETHAEAATAIAGIIDTWMRTGIATLIAPPFTIVPWS